MDVHCAMAPEAAPSPARTPPVGPPDTRGRRCLAPPGPARPRLGWQTRVLPAPDIAIATRAVLHPVPALGQLPLLGPQILGYADAGITRP